MSPYRRFLVLVVVLMVGPKLFSNLVIENENESGYGVRARAAIGNDSSQAVTWSSERRPEGMPFLHAT
jgi:type IV secretory pathway TrbL component